MSVIHFCIDMQILEGKKFHAPIWGCLKSRVLGLVEDLESRDIQTVFMAYADGSNLIPFESGVGLLRDTPPKTLRIMEQRQGLKFDLPLTQFSSVAYKNYYSAQRESSISSYVKRNGISQIILSGVWEGRHQHLHKYCVSETARDFALDCDVVIAAEATNRGLGGDEDFMQLEQRRSFHAQLGVRVDPIEDILAHIDAAASSQYAIATPRQEWSKSAEISSLPFNMIGKLTGNSHDSRGVLRQLIP